jgi:hypothetical protein
VVDKFAKLQTALAIRMKLVSSKAVARRPTINAGFSTLIGATITMEKTFLEPVTSFYKFKLNKPFM